MSDHADHLQLRLLRRRLLLPQHEERLLERHLGASELMVPHGEGERRLHIRINRNVRWPGPGGGWKTAGGGGGFLPWKTGWRRRRGGRCGGPGCGRRSTAAAAPRPAPPRWPTPGTPPRRTRTARGSASPAHRRLLLSAGRGWRQRRRAPKWRAKLLAFPPFLTQKQSEK